MSKSLRIAPKLALDPDYVGGRTFALLAKKGAGKSYLARVMAEEFWTAKIPFVLLDPMGTSWGLRSSADGKGEGIPVAIFGGEHADAPLERTGGKLLADLVVDEGLSMVLDMSELGSRSAERQFAHDFLERLYRRNRDLVHLLLDEADLFAPQNPRAGDQPLLGVTENIVRRGRNRGVGITLITQRPAVLNKDVLTQVDGLVMMQITGLTDRKAVDEWVKGHADPEEAAEVKPTLAGLHPGDCWWWIPELGILQKVKIRQSRTFDSSPTQKRGGRQAQPKSFADVDMGAIGDRMAATIERAKAEDPKELRREVAKLRKELAGRPEPEAPEPEVVEVPVLANGVVDELGKVAEILRGSAGDLNQTADKIVGELRRVSEAPDVAQRQVLRKPSPPPREGSGHDRRRRAREEVGDVGGGEGLSTQAQKMLRTLVARHPLKLTRAQWATFSGYSLRSSSWSQSVKELDAAGLVIRDHGEFEPTEAAFEMFGGAPPEPESPEQVRATWRASLRGPQAVAFFDALIEVHPHTLTRDELSERTGYSKASSSFSSTISLLRKNKLIEDTSEGLRASEALFDEVPA